MAIPLTGSVSMNDIHYELTGFYANPGDNISLSGLCSGYYDAINQFSTYKPSGVSPYSINEFRGYDHAAIDCSTLNTFSFLYDLDNTDNICNTYPTGANNYYIDTSSIVTATVLYDFNNCQKPIAGYYGDNSAVRYWDGNAWEGGWTSCGG